MRILLALIIAAALSIVLVLALPYLKASVIIEGDGWDIQSTLFVLILSIVTLIVTVKLLIWLWNMPGNTLRKFIEKRAIAQLELGMLALSQGDWRKAERALKQSARRKDQAALSYLGAAQAAQERGDEAGMESYLEKADQSSVAHQPVQITRAQLLLSSRQPEQALAVLDDIRKPRENRIKILELLGICYEKLEKWSELQELLPDLIKAGVLDSDQATHLQLRAATARLQDPKDAQSIDETWQSFDRKMKQNQLIVREYAENSLNLGNHPTIEKVLRGSLNQQWDEPLIRLYGQLMNADTSVRDKQLKNWNKRQPDSAGLHFALGVLRVQQEHVDEAIEHFQTSADLKPDRLTLSHLADELEKKGEHRRAIIAYKRALKALD